MKVLLFALTGFGNAALRALKRKNVTVAALVTRKEPGPFPHYPEKNISEIAKDEGIPVFEDPAIQSREFIDFCAGMKPDLIVCSTFHKRLPKMLLSAAPLGAVNVHPSLLPRYRGATPTHWALILGERETGVSVHRMTVKTDAGAILIQRTLAIDPDESDGGLRRKLSRLSEDVIEDLIDRFRFGREIFPTDQDESLVTYFPRVHERDALIDFDEPSVNIHNRIRGTSPLPGAHTFLGLERIKILSSRILPGKSFEVKPGLILGRTQNHYLVQTKDGVLELEFDPQIPLQGGSLFLGKEKECAAVDSPDEIKSRVAHTLEAYGIPREAEEFPKMVVVSVAYPCNAKCPNCPYTETNSDLRLHYQDAPFIDPEIFKKVARECGPYGSYVRITGGGEPLLHPNDMVALIEYAKSVNARVWLNTNGSLLDPERGRRLLACGTDLIEFSVDAADRETYSIVRAGLDFDQLVGNVTAILSQRNRARHATKIVASVINQDFVREKMPEIIQFWKTLGVDEVIKRKFLTWGSNTTLKAEESADATPYLNKETGVPCPFPFHRLNVDTRGKIEVCGYDISGRTNFGNVRHQTIREIWKGPQFEWWRRMHAERRGAEIPLCRECPDWQYRSWKHNWEKVIETAESHREAVLNPDFETNPQLA